MTQSLKCLDDDTLFKYMDNQLKGKNLRQVERHLNECSTCLRALSNLIKLTTTPATEDEKKILETIEQVPIEDRLESILQSHNIDQPSEPLWETLLRKAQNWLFPTFATPTKRFFAGPAYILSYALILFASFAGIRFYNTTYQIMRAQNTMEQNYAISAGMPRLNGDYRYNKISLYMNEESEQSYLNVSQNRLAKALKHNPDSDKASVLLVQTFIMENQFDKADSIVQRILQRDKISGTTFNDIGVLYFQKQHYNHAEAYFQKSIDAEPTFLLAYYNLSLTKNKLGKRDEAIELIRQYIHFEKDDTWNAAAQNLLRDYQEDRDSYF